MKGQGTLLFKLVSRDVGAAPDVFVGMGMLD